MALGLFRPPGLPTWGPYQDAYRLFMGMIPTACVLWALLHWRQLSRAYRATAIVGLAALFVAFGEYTPIHRALYDWVPLFNSFRYPPKALVVTMFVGAVLAGAGADRLAAQVGQVSSRLLAASGAVLLLISLLGWGLLVARPELASAALGRVWSLRSGAVESAAAGQFYRDHPELLIQHLGRLFTPSLRWGAALGFGMAAVVLVGRGPRAIRFREAGVAVALIAATMAGAWAGWGGPMRPDNPQSYEEYRGAPVLAWLRSQAEDEWFRVTSTETFTTYRLTFYSAPSPQERQRAFNALPRNSGTYLELDEIQEGTPVYIRWYADLLRRVAGPRLDSPDPQSPLLNLMNVKYVVTHQQLLPPRYRLRLEDDTLRVYENMKVLPRAFALPLDLADTFAEAGDAVPTRAMLSPNQRVEQVSYQPDRVVLNAQVEAPARLILTDLDYPGWLATVNGERVSIERFFGAFRSVTLPAGDHRVVFAYRPWSFTLGLGVSLVSGVLWLGVLGYGGWRLLFPRVGPGTA